MNEDELEEFKDGLGGRMSAANASDPDRALLVNPTDDGYSQDHQVKNAKLTFDGTKQNFDGIDRDTDIDGKRRFGDTEITMQAQNDDQCTTGFSLRVQ